ncbi:MAG: hypothetical protein KatS3mg023_3905 [Armatimonadota bacterium]|nr:MAG: hypothetical protein KatS3mg023_3905 [Armatimonadota bacterium]
MKRCPQCNSALVDGAVSCDLCGHSFVPAVTQSNPPSQYSTSHLQTDERVVEYTHQYENAGWVLNIVLCIGIIIVVHSIFFPTPDKLLMLFFLLIVTIALLFWKVFLRTKMVDIGYDQASVNRWEQQLAKRNLLQMLICLAVTIILLLFLVPVWYEQMKGHISFTDTPFR